ncbi:MAG TPA: protein-disulfide reductase DsbD domain-containing protein [Pyrinomonadaceae bacterium]|nr:protein-disulfide reductase DsbD domain-containing protein [Pyrinomonadaceae bacterium]
MLHTRTLLACLLLAFAAACSKSPTNSNEPAQVASVNVVKATPEETTIARGESGDLIVSLKIAKGYHVNANPPTYSYLIPTELQLQPSAGIAVQFITYPDPLTKKFPFAEKPLKVYEGDTLVKANLKADASAQPGKHNLSAKLRVQACDDKVCYAPGALDLTIPVDIK